MNATTLNENIHTIRRMNVKYLIKSSIQIFIISPLLLHFVYILFFSQSKQHQQKKIIPARNRKEAEKVEKLLRR